MGERPSSGSSNGDSSKTSRLNEFRIFAYEFASYFPSAPVPNDGVLYHYTSAESAIRILEGRALWMTALHHLNDPREFSMGADLLQGVAKELAAKASMSPMRSEFLKSLEFAARAPTIYVASFAEDPESLPQWRTYGDDGTGVAIGFDLGGCFYTRATDEDVRRASLHLMQVGYSRLKRRAVARSLLERVSTYVERRSAELPSALRETFLADARNWTPRHIAPHQIAFKHQSWGYEKEWRLVTDDSSRVEKVSLRVSRGRVIRHLADRIQIPVHLPVREVVLGPLREEDDVESFKDCLRELAGGVSIRHSRLSYRR